MKTSPIDPGWRFNSLWLCVTTLALGGGIALSSWITGSMRTPQTSQFLVSSLVSFTPLFVCQWLLLRHYGKETVWWIIVSIVATLIYIIVVSLLVRDSRPRDLLTTVFVQIGLPIVAAAGFISGAVFGLLLGSFQWLLLRQDIRGAVWWIVANALSFGAGIALSREMTQVFFYASVTNTTGDNRNLLLQGSASNGAGIILIACITTAILYNLLQRSEPSIEVKGDA